jgi:polyketide cyclase/dehydrase/lipid transport protein
MRFHHEIIVPGRTVEDVWEYVSDFNRAHEWRTEVTGSRMEPAGPMRTGSRLRETAVINGRTVVTDSVVDSCEAPHRFTFAHVAGPLPVSGEYLLTSAPDGTRLSYLLDVRLTGMWRLAGPLLRRSGRRMIGRSLATLADTLAPERAAGPHGR